MQKIKVQNSWLTESLFCSKNQLDMKDIFLIIYIFYNTMEFYVLVGTLTFVYEFNSAW